MDKEHGHAHEHHDDCDCGCHEVKLTVSLDGGEDVVCDVVGTFEVEGREYIALLPEGDDEVMLFRYSEEDGEPVLDDIESDEEYEAAGEAFYDVFMGDEFDDEDIDDEDEEDDDEE